MAREGNSDPIPTEIILEILSRSSTKSIARFGLASKSCASILSRPDFTKLFSTRSSTRPRLLFAVENPGKWSLYSVPQLQNPDEKHSLVVAADFHMQFLGDMTPTNMCGRLLCFSYKKISIDDEYRVSLICNPSTGQYTILPQMRRQPRSTSLLGYDPIDKQYKVLAIGNTLCGPAHILTLGTGEVSWRTIDKFPLDHYPISEGICIDGVLYYISTTVLFNNVKKIASFNIRSEELTFPEPGFPIKHVISSDPQPTKLINYKGKFGVISWRWNDGAGIRHLHLFLWISCNVGQVFNKKWLKYEYTFPVDVADDQGDVSVVGVTAIGEIILSMDCASKPFFVFYFNPERNTLEKVEIQGFEASENRGRVKIFIDYTEDLKFI